MSNSPSQTEVAEEQPLVHHLIELRSRLLNSLVVVGAFFLCLFYFSQDLYTLLAQPLLMQLPQETQMIATEVASPFLAPFKLTLMLSICLAMPFILFQMWSFVAPGLYGHEKRFAVPLFVSSVFLFYLGILFAYFIVFPLIFAFFTQVAPEGVTVMTDISHYLDFVLKLFFAFGLAFEVPIATWLIVRAGLVEVKTLSNARPYIIVGAFVIGMLLTPPDIFSQTFLALPMWILFEIGLFFAKRIRQE